MKKPLKTLLAVLAAVTLTGCMRIKMTVDVTSDAALSESVTMLFDESMLSEMGTDTAGMRESMKQSFTEGDEKVVVVDAEETIGDKKYVGITAKVGGFPWVFVIVGVALAGVAAYFLMNNKKSKQNNAGMSAVAQEFQPDVATPEEAQSLGEMAEKSIIPEEAEKTSEKDIPETHESGEF